MVKLQIQTLAQARNHDIKSLSRITGLASSTIRRYWNNEVRRVHLATLDVIAEALRIEVAELFVRSTAKEFSDVGKFSSTNDTGKKRVGENRDH